MDLALKDKVVLITGGAKGIGAAIAQTVAQEGAIPVIVDRDQEAAEKLRAELQERGSISYVVIAELATAEACSGAVEQTLKKFARIDALVNNAGVNDGVGLEKGTPDQFVVSLQRNLLHYYHMAHYAVPHLKRAGGCIVSISSKTAVTGQGGTSGYVASKGAILALTRAMQVDYAPFGIRVNALLPGTIHTPFVEKYLRESYPNREDGLNQIRKRQLTSELGKPEDVASAALFLASDESSFVMGTGLFVDGGVRGGK